MLVMSATVINNSKRIRKPIYDGNVPVKECNLVFIMYDLKGHSVTWPHRLIGSDILIIPYWVMDLLPGNWMESLSTVVTGDWRRMVLIEREVKEKNNISFMQ